MELSQQPSSEMNEIKRIKQELSKVFVSPEYGVVSKMTSKSESKQLGKFELFEQSTFDIPITYIINETKVETFMTGIEKILMGKNYSNKCFELSVLIGENPVYTTELSINDYDYGTDKEIEKKHYDNIKCNR